MSYADLRDFEPEYTLTTQEGVTVQIEKLGGGTLGKSYPMEYWRYIVTDPNGIELGRGQDLYGGLAGTHAEVAEICADFFDMEGWN